MQKVYREQDQPIMVHQSRVTSFPDDIQPGCYWYGRSQSSVRPPPRWIEHVTTQSQNSGNLGEPAVMDDLSQECNARGTSQGTEFGSQVEEERSTRTSHRYPLRNRVRPLQQM